MKATLNSAFLGILFTLSAAVAGAAPVRVAVIPFSAPSKNGTLQQAAEELPELLTVALSGQNRFEVVERTKVNAIWSELHLAEDGYVSAATAERLGHILSCDWLVGGSLVQIGTNTEVWIKVIDVQSGVVLDLETFPYDPKNVSATVGAIPSFLAGINPHSQPHQFIALGRFADLSLSASRADWSQRLPALIEKHFLAAGYGVVEREAIASIFSESQFESSGMTGDDTNRVVLKPAFWVVDGGYKWVYDTQEKLSVALRVQRIGGAPQVFRFDKPAADVEEAVIECIQSTLTNAPQTTPDIGRADESATDTKIAMRYATGHDEFAHGKNIDTIIATTRRDTINKLKQAVLLDPHAMQPKYMLGRALFISLDPEESRQGKEILEEVAASNDPEYATRAKNLMDDFATGRLTIRPLRGGMFMLVPHGQPLSWPTSPKSTAFNFPPMHEFTNIVPRAKSVAQIKSPYATGYFVNITAAKCDHGKVFVACNQGRVQLFEYDVATETTVEIKLPKTLDHPIDTIETDENSLWLGTDGNGVVRISKTGEPERVFSENDGLPTASVSSLQWDNGRLLVGFDNKDAGYIDPGTGKFTGQMSDVNIFKPPSYTGQYEPLPPPPGTNASFIATLVPQRCIAYCPPHGTHWTSIDLSTNLDGDMANSCMMDQTHPNLAWIGGMHGKVTVVDLETMQVIAECHLDTPAWTQWIFDDGDKVIFIAPGRFSPKYCLFCLNKSALDGQPVAMGTDPAFDPDWPNDFLRANLSRFVTVQFQKGADGQAVLQRLRVQDNMFMFGGGHNFFGIRFTVPQWCDGDFQWMYAIEKTWQNRFFASSDTQGVMTESGDPLSAPDLADDVNNYPRLREILPYTGTLHIVTARRDRLEPGKSYIIWFDVPENDYPDIRFAMTINSTHGFDQYGTLPLTPRQVAPEPELVTTDNPPSSPEQLRSKLETALKAKDTAAALSLVYWRGSTHIGSDEHFPQYVFSREGVRGKIDEMMARDIGRVRLTGQLYGLRTTNDFEGFRYRPNIQPVGFLTIIGHNWVKDLVYGKYGNGYYIPVGVKESLDTSGPGQ